MSNLNVAHLLPDGFALQKLAEKTGVTLPDMPRVLLLMDGQTPNCHTDAESGAVQNVPSCKDERDIVVNNLTERSFSEEQITKGIAGALLRRKYARQAHRGLRIGGGTAVTGLMVTAGDCLLHDAVATGVGGGLMALGLGWLGVAHYRNKHPPTYRDEGFKPPIRFIKDGEPSVFPDWFLGGIGRGR